MAFDLNEHMGVIPDFPKPGIIFRDISPLLKNYFSQTMDVMEALFSEEEWEQIDVVAGIDSRGFIFASALADRRKKQLVMVRKAGKLPNVAGRVTYDLEYGTATLEMQEGDGSKIIILDDLIATGGSMQAACDLATQVGYQVAGMAALVDLKALNSFEWHGMRVRSAVQYDD